MSLRHSLLALLTRKPKTGYELSKDFQESAGFFWSATHQQIYKDLHDLEASGWVRFREVTQKDKPDKKIYALTRAGREELKRWACEESHDPPSKDGFLIRLFVGDLIESATLLGDLRKQRARHLARLKRYQDIEAKYFSGQGKQPARRRYQRLTLKRGLMYEAFWLAWSQEVEEVLLDTECSSRNSVRQVGRKS